jgi:cytochrome c oxidase cbb3-type subunit 3/ubiquinol-cytochrome c reductase cytochrome c subunit
MSRRIIFSALLLCALPGASTGCRAPGYPKPGSEVVRPEQVLDFPTLYKQNCAACHGADGKYGAAISLNNPVYLAVAGENNLRTITANGVTGTLMPPFAKISGGTLTDQQIENLTQGMIHAWGNPAWRNPVALGGQNLPPYASSTPGDPVRGQEAFTTFCARCHGADGAGASSVANDKLLQNGSLQRGSLIDPSYLALVSDQNLRSMILAGQPEQGMPDWRSDISPVGSHAMTDQEITDTVAWLASHRVKSAGLPYPEHP